MICPNCSKLLTTTGKIDREIISSSGVAALVPKILAVESIFYYECEECSTTVQSKRTDLYLLKETE